MKRLFLILVLFMPQYIFAQEDTTSTTKKQQIFFSTEAYYGGNARTTISGKRVNIFEGGTGFNLKFDNGVITSNLDFHAAISLEGATPHKKVASKGDLGFKFAYLAHEQLESFITNLNEYDRLAGLFWRAYTGIGIRIILIRNNYLFLTLDYAPIHQYEKYMTGAEVNPRKKEVSELSYLFRGLLDISFLEKLKFQLMWSYIPTYRFDRYRLIFDTSLGVQLFRVNTTRLTGADFTMGFRGDYFSQAPTDLKKVDLILYSSVRFFM